MSIESNEIKQQFDYLLINPPPQPQILEGKAQIKEDFERRALEALVAIELAKNSFSNTRER
jgi:hypothetical protein